MADGTRGGSNDAALPLIATDDAGAAGQVQIVKLAQSADGSATPLTADADGLVVNLGANNDVTVTGSVSVSSAPSTAVTNAGTFAVQDAAAETSLAILDDWDESDRAKVNPIAGQAGVAAGSGVVTALTQRVVLATDVALPAGTNAIGKLSANSGVDIGDVDVTSLPALVAGSANIGDVDVLTVPAPLSTTGGGTEATAHRVTIANDSTGVLSVDDNGTSLTVDGTVAVSTLPALVAGTANIGDVDVLTLPNVTLAAGTNTNEVVGDVAHDVAAAGNPILNAGISQDMDDTAPPNVVAAEGRTTRLATDRDGVLFAHPHGPRVWSYHENSSSALTDTSVHAAPAAGLSLYVTDIIVSTGAATAFNIFFEEGASTVLGPYYLEAVAGRGLAIHFMTPKKITAATALTVTTSAAIAHAIDVTGFTAQG